MLIIDQKKFEIARLQDRSVYLDSRQVSRKLSKFYSDDFSVFLLLFCSKRAQNEFMKRKIRGDTQIIGVWKFDDRIGAKILEDRDLPARS